MQKSAIIGSVGVAGLAATEDPQYYAAAARPGRSFFFSHKGMPKPPTGGRGATRAVRLSVVLFALASLPPLLFVALTAVSPARFTVSVPNLSGWTRLLPAAWQPAARQEQQAAATAQWVGPAPAALPAVILGTSERGRLVYGDRLKITFFETLGVSLGDEAAKGDHLVATVFPRMDLSTEYMVDEAGAIDIPKLGQFTAAGKNIPALQSELAAAFERALGRSSNVNVAIIERLPVYVAGLVRSPGSYKYLPGMTVLQVLAGAGGSEFAADTSRAIESIRETSRLRQAQNKLDALLVTQARLIAQRDNTDEIKLPPSIEARLTQQTADAGLSGLVAAGAATLAIERFRYQQQLSLVVRQVNISRAEVDAQNLRADQLKAVIAKKSARLHELEAIAAHGSVPQFKLTDVGVEIAELIARQEDLRVAITQAERRVVEAEIAQSNIELAQHAGIARELATVQQEIADCTQAIESSQAVSQVLRNDYSEAAGSASSSVTVTRRLGDGFIIMAASETTTLLPGDVVRVSHDGSPAAPGSEPVSHAQNQQK